MNRPKQFDREEVLSKATDLFWERGFEETSVSDIVASTKINKFSLYSEFGDKENLYLSCIDYYNNDSKKRIEHILKRKPLGLSNIESFLEERISHTVSNEIKGCLIFNSIIEEKVLTEKINKKIDSRVRKIKSLLMNCLNAAQKRKEISVNKDCKRLADFLVCFIFGMINIGMKDTTEEELRGITHDILSVIRN